MGLRRTRFGFGVCGVALALSGCATDEAPEDLAVISRTETKYPDYHRVWEDGRLVIGSYFGEDKHDDPNDYGARNLFQYLRAVLQARPELRVSAPGTDLTTVAFGTTPIHPQRHGPHGHCGASRWPSLTAASDRTPTSSARCGSTSPGSAATTPTASPTARPTTPSRRAVSA